MISRIIIKEITIDINKKRNISFIDSINLWPLTNFLALLRESIGVRPSSEVINKAKTEDVIK